MHSEGLGASIAVHNSTLFVGADLSVGVGEVVVDSAFLSTGLSEPIDEYEDDAPDPEYGFNGSSLFDTWPHAIVSTLLFFVLPGIAVTSLVVYRRMVEDHLCRPDRRFRILPETPHESEQETDKISRFKHESLSPEQMSLTRAEESEEMLIRV